MIPLAGGPIEIKATALQICKSVSRRGDEAIGAHTDQEPLKSWVPDHGELVGFVVSGHARTSLRNTEERSNIVMMSWP